MKEIRPHYVGRCEVCGKFSLKLMSIGWYGEYGWTSHYTYHEQCVYDCIRNPEKYTNAKVDLALDIFRCLEYHINIAKTNKDREDKFRLEELKRIQGLL